MLHRLRRGWVRYTQLTSDQKRMLFEAVALVGVVRGALYALPFRRVLRAVEKRAEACASGRAVDEEEVQRVLWAVGAAGRRLLPKRPCLTQALAARFMLARRGCHVQLIIGVAKEQEGPLKAHAWLERDGTVILGGVDSPTRYQAFPAISLSDH